MKLLVVGGGGREHAIIKKLKENKEIETIYALPGNGGMAQDAVCTGIGAKDIPAMVDFAVREGIDFAVVAPDEDLRPLAKALNAALSGRGGGRSDCIQGSAAAGEEEIRRFFAGR